MLTSKWENMVKVRVCNVERTVHVLAGCTGCSTAPHTALLYHVTSEGTGCSTVLTLRYYIT